MIVDYQGRFQDWDSRNKLDWRSLPNLHSLLAVSCCWMISHWLTENAKLNSLFSMILADGLVWETLCTWKGVGRNLVYSAAEAPLVAVETVDTLIKGRITVRCHRPPGAPRHTGVPQNCHLVWFGPLVLGNFGWFTSHDTSGIIHIFCKRRKCCKASDSDFLKA